MGVELIVAIVGFGITVLTFVWRVAVLSTKIHKNEDAIAAAHTRLDKYINKHENSIEEMKNQINAIVQTQVRIEEKLSFLIDSKKGN